MKKIVASIIMTSAFVLYGCGESLDPETLGAEYGKAQYECKGGKNREACKKAEDLEAKIQKLSDEEKLVAAGKALDVAGEMAAKEIGEAFENAAEEIGDAIEKAAEELEQDIGNSDY